MDRLEAAKVLETELECVKRSICQRLECVNCDLVMPEEKVIAALTKAIEWANAEEQGRLIVPPCKVGDTIYEPYLGRILERQVVCIVIQSSFMVIYCGGSSTSFGPADFGKTVFLSRTEAEAAIAAREKGGVK